MPPSNSLYSVYSSAAVQAQAAMIMQRCEQMRQYSETPGQLSRRFLSAPMQAVHRDLQSWMQAAGMQVHSDAAGNICGRYPNAQGNLRPRLLLGSHVDTVLNAGSYDGMLGVLLALAAVTLCHEAGRRFPFALELIAFSEEEGVRYSLPFLGSRAVVGTFDMAALALRDADGLSMAECIRAFGQDPEAIPAIAADYAPEDILGYVEFHLEQGLHLQQAGKALGVVRAIAGQQRARLRFQGRAGHAGTVPMGQRQDALCAAAAWLLEAEAYASDHTDMVATVGQLELKPGAINVIPGEVQLSLDLRHPNDATRQQALEHLQQRSEAIGQQRAVEVTWQPIGEQAAVAMDSQLSARIVAASQSLPQLAAVTQAGMVSGAGHDAMVLAPHLPSALVFVRSPNGISHHPEESVQVDDVCAALELCLALFEDLAAN